MRRRLAFAGAGRNKCVLLQRNTAVLSGGWGGGGALLEAVPAVEDVAGWHAAAVSVLLQGSTAEWGTAGGMAAAGTT